MAGHREFTDALDGEVARIGHALASPTRIETVKERRRLTRADGGLPEWRTAGLPLGTGA